MILFTLWLLLAIGTVIPETGNDFWLIRGQDYFKSFYAVFHAVAIIACWLPEGPIWLKTIISLISLSLLIYCLKSIIPYTSYARQTVADCPDSNDGETLSLLIFNVYQDNREYAKTVDLVNVLDPDMVFLLETDEGWDEALRSLGKEYPYIIREIRNDTYGLILFSKLPLKDSEVLYRVKKDIPSIEALIDLGDKEVMITGLHPKPPMPGESLFATKKDRELLQAAMKIRGFVTQHHLVIGDLNDVAWSSVTRMFKKLTGLKDPRQGRGFFATFPTWSPFRIPLDHVFCSPEFKLLNFKRERHVGSDHFPVYVKFRL